MKKIVAIGGAVIKTARSLLYEIINNNEVEMLIHNGGSLFHDFQLSLDPPSDNQHSYSLEQLLKDHSINQFTSDHVNEFIKNSILDNAPDNSITQLCLSKHIPVLLFTIAAQDTSVFWSGDENNLPR